MALPTPGQSKNNWGDILNDFLRVGHEEDGTVKGVESFTTGLGSARQILQRNPLVAETRWKDLPYLDVLDFYISGDAGNYAPAIGRAIAEAVTSYTGRAEIILPNRAESYATMQNISSYITLRGAGSASEIVVGNISASYRLFRSYGTVATAVALGTNAVAGSAAVTLPSGATAGFAVGDLIAFEAATITYGASGYIRDQRKIMGIVGDVVTLDSPLIYTYATADGAAFAKVTPIRDAAIRDLLISNPAPATNKGYFWDARNGEKLSTDNLSFEDAGGGIIMLNQLNPRITNHRVDGQPNGWDSNPSETGLGYVVAFAGATSGGIYDNIQARHVRHAFTTLSEERAGPTYWGAPRDCIVSNGVAFQVAGAVAGTSCWDTHAQGDYIDFVNLTGINGENGYQIRSKNTRLRGCDYRGNGNRAVIATSESSDTLVDGGVLDGGAVACVALSGPRSIARKVEAKNSSGPGIAIAADDCLIDGGYIHDNTNYGIQRISGDRLKIVGNPVIPFSTGKQTVGIQATGASDLVAIGPIALGYTADSAAFALHATARLRNQVTDLDGVFSSNGSITIPPYVKYFRSTSGSSQTITLPDRAASVGRDPITLTQGAAGSVVVTAAGSDTITGSATKTLGAIYSTITLKAGPSVWVIVSQVGTVT